MQAAIYHYFRDKLSLKTEQHLYFSHRVYASAPWDKNKFWYLLNCVLDWSCHSYLFKNICTLILSRCTIDYFDSINGIDKFKIINSIPFLIKITNSRGQGQNPISSHSNPALRWISIHWTHNTIPKWSLYSFSTTWLPLAIYVFLKSRWTI